MPIDARTRARSDTADHSTFARRVPTLEDHDDTRPHGLDPTLQIGQLALELRELLFELLAPHLAGCGLHPIYVVLLLLDFCHLTTLFLRGNGIVVASG